MWDTFGLQMLDVLAGVDPADGPIIDVGSGTGIGLAYLRAAVPDVRLVAIEPSKAMRVALHTRLSEFTELREQTTVIPTTFGDAPLPARASAMVLSALIGHLSDEERTRLWSYVATQTAPGAPVVVGVLPPSRPLPVDLLKYGERRIGDYVYEGWQSGVPLAARRMMWTMTYKVVDSASGATVAEYTATAPWRCDGVDDIRREIEPYGLEMSEHDDYVIVRRPA
jgi:phospholipid N-methyltransferase